MKADEEQLRRSSAGYPDRYVAMKNIKQIFLVVFVLTLPICLYASDSNRLTVQGKINGKTARFAIDTGMPRPVTILAPVTHKNGIKKFQRSNKTISSFQLEVGKNTPITVEAND